MPLHNIVGPNVVTLLAQQTEFVVAAAEILNQIPAADRHTRAALADQLHEVETDADNASHETLRKISTAFVLPFDREELYQLSSRIDDCVDLIDKAADYVVLYKLGPLPQEVAQFMEIIARCATITHEEISELNRISDRSRNFWVEINQLENQANQVHRTLISDLFEQELEPLTVMKLKSVFDSLEAIPNAFELLAEVVEKIAIKEA